MVDPAGRDFLAERLGLLATGRLSHEQFQAEGRRLYNVTKDEAIRAVFRFVAEEPPAAFVPRSRHARREIVETRLAHAILFLRTNLEYEWPPPHGAGRAEWLTFFFLLLAGGAVMAAFEFGQRGMLVAAVFSGLAAGLVYFVWLTLKRRRQRQIEEDFNRQGDYAFWPFLRKAEYEQAARSY